MKIRKPSIIFLLLFATALIVVQDAVCCSMFKITRHGRTMVGNNEDFWNPNTRIWFEQGGQGEYGAAYVGFDDFWPQGGVNQAGLVFDGFAEDFQAIHDTSGKIPLNGNFLKEIMKKCADVDEVKWYLSRHNLSGLESSMFFFVDKTGRYLVADGDSLITGDRESYLVSNFHPSQVKNECDVPISFYQKGRKFLENHGDTTVGFCASVMDTMHQESGWGAGTMYTTVYDLNEGTICLYFYHQYTEAVKFNLNLEIGKGDHTLVIPALFPGNKEGRDYAGRYNAISNAMELFRDEDILEDSIRYANVTKTLFENDMRLIRIFSGRISEIGNSWMDKGNYAAAANVFRINVRLLPGSWTCYEELAYAFAKNKQYELAIMNYEKSVNLNPENPDAKRQIERIKQLMQPE